MLTHHPHIREGLLKLVLPELVCSASADAPVRVWIPACSTGEQAYLLAVSLFEEFDRAHKAPHLRIFATDRDEGALAQARSGLSERRVASTLPREMLERYFHRTTTGAHRINDAIRSALVFGTHDILKDPPLFSNLGLISYRSVPAPLQPEVLKRLTSRIHFALRDSGWLELQSGRCEAAAAGLFEPVDTAEALYRKRLAPKVSPPVYPMAAPSAHRPETDLVEELRAANTTIAAMAEELDGANQQLRGSNADLRSLSEELVVVNNELQLKIRAINEANADLTALIVAIDVAVVILDARLCVRRFTTRAAELLALTPADVENPLTSSPSELIDSSFQEEARHVLLTATSSEMDVPSSKGRWFLRRMLPSTVNEPAPGVVVTWVEITQTKALQHEVLSIAALEQQRIGRELHDDIQQELTGLSLLAKSLSEDDENANTASKMQLSRRLLEGIVEANRHVRSLARGLVPIPVDTQSLMPALVDLARRTQNVFGVTCEFEQIGSLQITDTQKASHLYRIAQEAVRNAARHAEAETISIRLESRNGELLLEIRDDGIGIGARSQIHQGMGVRLMEHRCSLIGGRFAAERQPGGGTRITCRVPSRAPS